MVHTVMGRHAGQHSELKGKNGANLFHVILGIWFPKYIDILGLVVFVD
jgi:hypothetical protein